MIVLENVDARRGPRVVLDGVSLRVEPGETLVLVGRSGAGKSTALKLINRMLDPERGRVLVDGRDTRDWDPIALRRTAGYILQDVGLFPHMTVRRNVGIVPELSGWRQDRIDARADALLALVGLAPHEFGNRWPAQLSGGQRQRVGVARALALDPPLLLMDEPFGALDAVTRGELHREFARVQREVRKTIVLVTHDMREAFALGDRIGVLHEGRLVACGDEAGIRASAEPAVRALLDAALS